MKQDVIIDYTNIKEVYEILLDNQPNIEFNITALDKEYTIEIRTFVNNQTFISIRNDEYVICHLASIKTNIDLAYLNGENNLVFFFDIVSENQKEQPYNYLDFNSKIKFYYGII